MQYPKISMKATAVAIILLVVAGCQEPEITMDDRLEEVLQEELAHHDGKGVSAAVLMPDDELWLGVAGISHEATRITQDMMFNIAGATKIFTAALVLDLVEDNILSINDPISKWLPDLENVDSTILIVQLLNHTSGVYNFSAHPSLADVTMADPSKIWTPQEVIESFVLEPHFAPGAAFAYSETGYLLLGLIVESATGSDFETILKERILDPVGLQRTSLGESELAPGENSHPWGDIDDDGELDDFSFLMPVKESIFWVGGGMNATAEDLIMFLRALMEGGIIGPASLDEMLRFRYYGYNSSYGLGIGESTLPDGAYSIGYNSSLYGSTETLCYLPELDVYFSILQNTSDWDMKRCIMSSFMEIIREYY